MRLFLFVKKLFNGQKKKFFGLKISFLMNKKDKKTETKRWLLLSVKLKN